MMRWLKDKKRGEKRASQIGAGSLEDAGKEEDDYGFEKEKTSNKSPVIKRQLPPTPAAPEEKSTHIYEEIPDLHVSCTPEHERPSLLKNKKSSKAKSTSSNLNLNHNQIGNQVDKVNSGANTVYKDDSISPYMVVPVDEQVRQTPPHFHRDGTPEVHCDVIVKETHCEILLTRKPKVGAFRLDASALTGSESSVGASRVIRNNTHFCSLNRRASVDVQAGGSGGGDSKGTSAFSWSSSAFSSASTSKVNSMATSSMSLSTLAEHRVSSKDQTLPASVPEGDSAGGSSDSSVKGVLTYSTGGNFIPRSTKLVFKPLTPLDPDFFDDPEQDVNLRNAERMCNGQISNSGTHLPSRDNDDDSIEYTSVQGQMKLESDSPIVYSAIQNDQMYGTQQMIPSQGRGQCKPSSPPPSFQDTRHCQAGTDQNSFRSTLVRPYSPSTSSSCTYASINFPPESRLYNTIQDVDLAGTTATPFPKISPCPANRADGDSILPNYQSGQFDRETIRFPDKYPQRPDLSHQNPLFQTNQADSSNFLGRAGHLGPKSNADVAIYAGVTTPRDFGVENTYACIDASKTDDTGNHTTSSLLQNKLNGHFMLEFCRCREYNQQYASCGCADLKSGEEDDNASVSTINNDLKGSCGGCGRLIKQITYSESYSDETYEHAYSSRLLLRRGRRFSSPDITMSEISVSESQDLHAAYGGSPFSTMSRDDMWSRPQICDVRSTFYRSDRSIDSGSAGQFTSADHSVVLNAREQLSKDVQKESNAEEEKPIITKQRKSFCAFSSNDINLPSKNEQGKPPSLHHLKRTSLPLNMIPCPLMNVDTKTNKPSAVSQLQPKSSAFSGLFSKFARTKSKTTKHDDEMSDNSQHTSTPPREAWDERQEGDKGLIAGPEKKSVTGNQIPEKNTLKLSKFFQRLSSKESGCENQNKTQNFPDCEIESERSEEYSRQFTSAEVQKDHLTHHTTQPILDSGMDRSMEAHCFDVNLKHVVKNNKTGEKTFRNNDSNNSKWNNNNDMVSAKSSVSFIGRDLSNEDANSTAKGQASASSGTDEANSCLSPAPETGSKVKAKTDSGDTCYEYDISTSSEGEQTSYDYFLSKVKKSLNLEKEVQHIADMNALRKKLLCKICKKEGVASASSGVPSNQDDLCLMDGACGHEPSFKCSDWRRFFGEVDQRTAILNCLTDFVHSPYAVKGDSTSDSNHCRECGGEILTSDSESLTTVYSILSQHLRMTSPETRTPSCDSDEGTMADNSCESGDEDDLAPGEGEEDSSGFDDDDVGGLPHNVSGSDVPRSKIKKKEKPNKERREKKSFYHSSFDRAKKKSQWSQSKTDLSGHQGSVAVQDPGLIVDSIDLVEGLSRHKSSSRRSSTGGGKIYSLITNSSSLNNLSTNRSTNNGTGEYGVADDVEEAGCESKKNPEVTTRTKSSLLATDKAIQDIYAPLPSKALSWLTARNGGGQRSSSCACNRIASHTSEESPVKPSPDIPELTTKTTTSTDAMEEKGVSGNVNDAVDQKLSSIDTITSTRKSKDTSTALANCKDVLSGEPKIESVDKVVAISPIEQTANPEVCSKTVRSDCIQSKPPSHVTVSPKEPNQSPPLNISRRRSRQFPLAALDLLPETALGSDVVEDENTTPTPTATSKMPDEQTLETTASIGKESTKQRLVERMARLFESNSVSAMTKDKDVHSNIYDVTQHAQSNMPPRNTKEGPTDKNPSKKQKDEYKRQLSPLDNDNAKAVTLTPNGQDRLTRHVRTSSLGISPKSLTKTLTLSHPNIHEKEMLNESQEDAKKQSVGSAKRISPSSDNLKKTATPLSHSEERKSSTRNSNNKVSQESRSKSRESSTRRSTQSPGSLSSSSSSSSPSRRRNGAKGGGHLLGSQTRQKRLSKKSHHSVSEKIKAKTNERKKKKKREGGGMKEEKTYYCFSSDMSDIDVMEMAELDDYASQRSVSQSRRNSANNHVGDHGNASNSNTSKEHRHRKDRSASRSRMKAATNKKSHMTLPKDSKSNNERLDRKLTPDQTSNDGDDCELVQEVYSMPPNSSEVCEVKGHRDDTQNSPTVSPDLQKLRKKSKRTDIYRTKRSNNRLLSDLIIRNYDRQVFGNV